jgi:hypothetical protein
MRRDAALLSTSICDALAAPPAGAQAHFQTTREAAPVAAWAGPPSQTDDPEPIGFRHYEFYTLFTVEGTVIETDT